MTLTQIIICAVWLILTIFHSILLICVLKALKGSKNATISGVAQNAAKGIVDTLKALGFDGISDFLQFINTLTDGSITANTSAPFNVSSGAIHEEEVQAGNG